MKNVRNEICKWCQSIALIFSCITIYKERLLETICTYLFILVIEFTVKDRKDD